MRRIAAVVRLAAGVVGLAALALHLDYSLGSGASALPNFFSYFTMQSAMAAVLLWFVSGVRALRRPTDPAWLVTARLLVTGYQIVSGAVYTVIVLEAVARGIPIQVPVSSQVLHYWLPAYALVDWLAFPGRGRPRWRSLALVPVFPLVWGGFTMLRGSVVGWYPYFFLDPYQVESPAVFVLYSAAVLTFIGVVAALLALVGRILPPGVRSGRPAGKERSEVAPGGGDELGVVEVRDRERVLAAHEADEHR